MVLLELELRLETVVTVLTVSTVSTVMVVPLNDLETWDKLAEQIELFSQGRSHMISWVRFR